MSDPTVSAATTSSGGNNRSRSLSDFQNRSSLDSVGRKVNDSGRKRLSFIPEGGSDSNSHHNMASSESGKCTSKNIECILTVLHLVHQHGEILGSAWHLVLTTLQVNISCLYLLFTLSLSLLLLSFSLSVCIYFIWYKKI